MSKPFIGLQYVTRGVHEAISMDIQMLLWRLIHQKRDRGVELDYLQVFELTHEQLDCVQSVQKILMRQGQPPMEEVVVEKSIVQPITTKIWVIDNGEYSTMLFPNEY